MDRISTEELNKVRKEILEKFFKISSILLNEKESEVERKKEMIKVKVK
jgi:hypothetical protein